MPKDETEFTVDLPEARARRVVLAGIRASGLGFRFVEDQGEMVVATTTASLRSFGETITVKVHPTDSEHSTISVKSASAAALIDWGKNADNVSRVERAIRARTDTA